MKRLLILFSLIVVLWTTNVYAQSIEINETISDTLEKWETRSYPLHIKQEGFLTVQFNASMPEQYTRYHLVHIESDTEIDTKIISNATSFTYGIQPGEYEIRVTGIGNIDTTTFPFQFVTSFKEGFTYDQEPNNTMAYAKAIPPNTLIQQTGGYRDMYTITITKPQNIVFSSSNDARIMLYYNDEMIGDSAYFDELIVPVKAGTYSVVAEGDYAFSYALTTIEERIELEPNETIKDAVTLPVNEKIRGMINTSFDYDTFKFIMHETGFAHFKFAYNESNNYSAKYVVYNEFGEKLFHFEDKKPFQMGLEKGTYYIKMSHTKTGMPYTVEYSIEPNDLPNIEGIKQQLPLNKTLTANSPGTLGWINEYQLSIAEAGYYEFNITPEKNSRTSISINGTQLYNGYSAMSSSHSYRIGLDKGIYNVNLNVFDTPYTLKVTQLSRYAEHEPNHIVSLSTPLMLSKETYGNVDVHWDTDHLTFTLDKAQLVSWNISSKSDVPLQLKMTESTSRIVVEEEKTNHIGAKVLKKGKYFIKITAPQSTEYTVTVKPVTPVFIDVPAKHPFYNDIMRMYALGIITGYGDGTFKPKDALQRQHVAAMIVRSQAPAIKDMTTPFAFPDVSSAHPNYMNIQKLVSSGIVDANPKGFDPGGTITRAQMAKILIKAYDLEGSTYEETSFKDVKKSDWYYDYVQRLAFYGITVGDNGYFKPNEPLSRQHFTAFLSRMLQLHDPNEMY